MNIALLGYGRMGKAIDDYCQEHTTHKIIARINEQNIAAFSRLKDQIDVVINFSVPEVATEHLSMCFDFQLPVVCGTTGWLKHWSQVVETCKNKNGSLFYSSNFSIGTHLFWKMIRHAAKQLNRYNYTAKVEETHHIHKLDAPSGTAITTAKHIIEEMDEYTDWVLGIANEYTDLPIFAHRKGEVIGKHTVMFENDVETISIEHNAKSRKGFVIGAVKAAEFLNGKTGIYTMADLVH